MHFFYLVNCNGIRELLLWAEAALLRNVCEPALDFNSYHLSQLVCVCEYYAFILDAISNGME